MTTVEHRIHYIAWLAAVLTFASAIPLADAQSAGEGALSAADKVVKLFGAGGMQGIEAYQTGLIVSPEGHVATADSLVLDDGQVTVITASGDRHAGRVIGADRISGIAVVKFDPGGQTLAAFDLATAATAGPGETVIALANVFGIATGGEAVSAMQGYIAAVAPLDAVRPRSRVDSLLARNLGDVYQLDMVTSNPGAAGGALVDHRGRLLGMIGVEKKSRLSGAWLNYALPAKLLAGPVERIIQGEQFAVDDPTTDGLPLDLLATFGLQLTPEIVPRSPPFVDYVARESLAAMAGLTADDLVVSVNGLLTGSAAELRRVLRASMRDEDETEPLRLVVDRGGELIELNLPRE